MLEKARQGIWPSRAPLGYRNVLRADGKRIIEVDPEMASKIVRLFQDYATGQHSIKALTKLARAHGIAYRKSGMPVPRSTLHQLLQNPLYIGEFDWVGIRYKGVHTPLISHELFDKVQDRMSDRATNCRHEQKREFAFSGLVYCGKCSDEGHQRMLIGSLIKKQYIYYHCERCKELGRNKYVREVVLDEGFETALERLRISPAALDLVKRSLLAAHQVVRNDRDERIAALQGEYDKLTQKIDAAYDDRLEGRIDIAFFDRKAREWREQQARVRRDLANVAAADESALQMGLDLFELASTLTDRYAVAEVVAKRTLLSRTASNSVWRGDKLEVTFRKVYQLLENLPPDTENTNAPAGVPGGVSGRWLPVLDVARTMVCSPDEDLRAQYELAWAVPV